MLDLLIPEHVILDIEHSRRVRRAHTETRIRNEPTRGVPGYVYRAYASDGSLLYVGQTREPLRRIKWQHRHESSWYPHAVRIDLTRFDSIQEALADEARAIEQESPIFNRTAWCVDKHGRQPGEPRKGSRR